MINEKALGCTDKPNVECSEFVTQTIAFVTLAIETRSTKIVAIALDLLTQLMKVGAVHGTFPLSKDQSGLLFIYNTNHHHYSYSSLYICVY